MTTMKINVRIKVKQILQNLIIKYIWKDIKKEIIKTEYERTEQPFFTGPLEFYTWKWKKNLFYWSNFHSVYGHLFLILGYMTHCKLCKPCFFHYFYWFCLKWERHLKIHRSKRNRKLVIILFWKIDFHNMLCLTNFGWKNIKLQDINFILIADIINYWKVGSLEFCGIQTLAFF